MKKVFAAGTFLLLHPGHIFFLEHARRLGTHLTVVVASDDSLSKKLGCVPVTAKDRMSMVASLKCVDEVRVGNPGDLFRILNVIRPDIIALGYDQQVNIAALKQRLRTYKIQADIRRTPKLEGYSTRKIIRNLINQQGERRP